MSSVVDQPTEKREDELDNDLIWFVCPVAL